MLEIIKFNALKPGKNLLITGAVHGDEICGAIASQIIIQKLKSGFIELESGSVTFIPICNPEAYKLNKREFATNLNRAIKREEQPKNYEEKIANILCDYIENADYHLDIHSMNNQNCEPFVFADHKEQEEFAEIMGLKYIYLGWPNVYKDSKTIKDFSTQAFAHLVNTINVTIECGYNPDGKSVIIAENCIMRALDYLGIYKNSSQLFFKEQTIIEMVELRFKEKEGELSKKYKEMELIKNGDLIAKYNSGEKIIADDDYCIIFPNNNKEAKIGDEWFYLGKYKSTK
jgi:predicted deacylase